MSDKKGSKHNTTHANRIKKRKFHGNQHTVEQSTEHTSTSAKKLLGSKNMDVPVSSSFAYCILEFATVFSSISSAVICKKCKSDITFTQSNLRGLGFKICLTCECDITQQISSCPVIGNACEINRRFVFVMRLLGVGHEGANLFCAFMDICQGIGNSTYLKILENIHTASSAVYETVLSYAVTEEKNRNKEAGNPEDELTVSGDGTWKKRGFSSLFGVSTVIGKYSSKVLDTCVMSSFCGGCNSWKTKKTSDPVGYEAWYASHEDDCTVNHTGSSGKMEIDAIVKMFSRSIDKYAVKYCTYIGDGDSKTFCGILKAEPYGQDHPVIKKECVGHVEKRMGTRLRNVKKTVKGIGGRGAGKLTDKLIHEMTKFVGLAIRRHTDSIGKMKKEIWATFYHKCSTDDNPQHQNCPAGEDSWCKWRKAESEGHIRTFHHNKPPLTKEVQEAIRPVYEELTKNDLLIRCLEAESQNNNESLNSLMWTFSPKHLHSGPKIVEIATFLAVMIFNEGYERILKKLNIMGCKIGRGAQAYVHHRDEARIDRSERRASDIIKKSKIDAKKEEAALRDFYETEESVLYGPGIAD